MTPEQARRNALMAGMVTAVAGPALVAAPEKLGTASGISNPRLLRAIGITDVVLAPGLLLAPRDWRWLAARAAVNAAVGSRLLGEPSWTAKSAGVAMLALTVLDGRSAAALRA